VLSELAPDLWVAEARLRYARIEIGRRMTVIRLADDALWIHSPVQLDGQLQSELDRLGRVRFVVPASSLHGHLYMEQYQAAYPGAILFAAPGLARKRPDLAFGGELSDSGQHEWGQEIEQTSFEGNRQLIEFEFLHRTTRTLITGDLCFNIGPQWPLATRLWAWGPRLRRRLGPTVAFRAAIRDRESARRSIERILEWDFDRILPGHGEIVAADGKRAFRAARLAV
jgi:hypothetical protein